MRVDDKEWLDMLERLRYGACNNVDKKIITETVLATSKDLKGADLKELGENWMDTYRIVVPRNPLRTAMNNPITRRTICLESFRSFPGKPSCCETTSVSKDCAMEQR